MDDMRTQCVGLRRTGTDTSDCPCKGKFLIERRRCGKQSRLVLGTVCRSAMFDGDRTKSLEASSKVVVHRIGVTVDSRPTA